MHQLKKIAKQVTSLAFISSFITANYLPAADLLSLENTSVEGSAQAIIDYLHSALESNNAFSARDDKALELFLNFANSFSASNNDIGPNTHLPLWADLAEGYLNIASSIIISTWQTAELNYFEDELSDRKGRQKTSYQWFVLFCNRLTILMTQSYERALRGWSSNTGFVEYLRKLINHRTGSKYSWKTHKGFKNACLKVGSRYTREAYSPLALTKFFPDIVMLPYPFSLSDTDILMSMPHPKNSHLWLVGFSMRSVHADGVLMNPAVFFAHDLQHLVILFYILSNECDWFVIDKESPIPSLDQLWGYTRQGRLLYFDILQRLQKMARENREIDQARMTHFLGFKLMHEDVAFLSRRMEFFLLLSETAFDGDGSLINEHYYLSLLPQSLQNIATQGPEFFKQMAEYVKVFQNDFKEHEEGDDLLLKKMREWRNHESYNRPYLIYSCCLDCRAYEAEDLISTEGECLISRQFPRASTNHQRVQRCCFMGSPLYVGENSPEYLIETMRFQDSEPIDSSSQNITD